MDIVSMKMPKDSMYAEYRRQYATLEDCSVEIKDLHKEIDILHKRLIDEATLIFSLERSVVAYDLSNTLLRRQVEAMYYQPPKRLKLRRKHR